MRVWAQDEGRLGLCPILRRVWAPRGKRPIAVHRRKYEWTWLYGFVHPLSGATFFLMLPRVETEAFSLALQLFCEAAGVDEHNHVVLVLDGAGWHRSDALTLPPGLHLAFLPPYSPELQPAERLWPLVNEVVANQLFEHIVWLEDAIEDRCVQLMEAPEQVRALCDYHWWPRDVVRGQA